MDRAHVQRRVRAYIAEHHHRLAIADLLGYDILALENAKGVSRSPPFSLTVTTLSIQRQASIGVTIEQKQARIDVVAAEVRVGLQTLPPWLQRKQKKTSGPSL